MKIRVGLIFAFALFVLTVNVNSQIENFKEQAQEFLKAFFEDSTVPVQEKVTFLGDFNENKNNEEERRPHHDKKDRKEDEERRPHHNKKDRKEDDVDEERRPHHDKKDRKEDDDEERKPPHNKKDRREEDDDEEKFLN